MNWIQILNDYTSFNDNKEIIYTPVKGEDIGNLYSEIETERQKALDKYISKIKCSDFFENGSIEFEMKFENDSRAFFSLTLNKISFYINSSLSRSAYSIRQNEKSNAQVKILSKSGTIGTVQVNKFFKVKINVEGSNIQFLINDIIVCEANELIISSQIKVNLRSSDRITIKNFRINKVQLKVFIVMQFTDEYNELYRDVIKPICESYDYECIRADEFYQTSLILNDIINSIKEASIIIADITPDNPNVFYEVGYAHALNKPLILLSDKKRQKLPFDVSGFRTLFYDNTIGGKSKVEETLKKYLDIQNTKNATSNSVNVGY